MPDMEDTNIAPDEGDGKLLHDCFDTIERLQNDLEDARKYPLWSVLASATSLLSCVSNLIELVCHQGGQKSWGCRNQAGECVEAPLPLGVRRDEAEAGDPCSVFGIAGKGSATWCCSVGVATI